MRRPRVDRRPLEQLKIGRKLVSGHMTKLIIITITNISAGVSECRVDTETRRWTILIDAIALLAQIVAVFSIESQPCVSPSVC